MCHAKGAEPSARSSALGNHKARTSIAAMNHTCVAAGRLCFSFRCKTWVGLAHGPQQIGQFTFLAQDVGLVTELACQLNEALLDCGGAWQSQFFVAH